MDENKKNRFLKGLWGKNKEDNSTQDQQLQEHEQKSGCAEAAICRSCCH